jgi:hypothetical protein
VLVRPVVRKALASLILEPKSAYLAGPTGLGSFRVTFVESLL